MNQQKLIHGIIDLDNVVSDWIGWVFSQRTEIPKAVGLRSGRIEDMWPDMSDEEIYELVTDIRGYIDAKPVPGALDAVRTLMASPKVSLLFLSAAPVDALEPRRVWLRKYRFPEEILENGALVHLGNSSAKTEWLIDNGGSFNFIIDDQLQYLDAALLAGIPVRLAFSQPWNSNDENHEFVYTWYQALSRLKKEFAI